MGASDFVLFGSMYGTGILWSWYISRPYPIMSQRLVIYHGFSHLFFVVAGMSTLNIVYRRLTGFADNGLRWSKPEDKLKKFDMTSHFEKSTGWKRFREHTD